MIVSDELVSIPEFARLCGGISHWTVRRWLANATIRGVWVGSRRMIPLTERGRVIKQEEDSERTTQE
jgi:hypothetical protein